MYSLHFDDLFSSCLSISYPSSVPVPIRRLFSCFWILSRSQCSVIIYKTLYIIGFMLKKNNETKELFKTIYGYQQFLVSILLHALRS